MLRPLLTPVRVTRNLDAKPEVGQMQVETMCSVSQPGPNQNFEVPATLRKNPGSAHQVEERPLQHLRMNVKFYFQSSNETPIHQSGQSILQPLERPWSPSSIAGEFARDTPLNNQIACWTYTVACQKYFGNSLASQQLRKASRMVLPNTSTNHGAGKTLLCPWASAKTVWLSVQSL